MRNMPRGFRWSVLAAIGFWVAYALVTPARGEEGNLNDPDRLEEFRDLGVGMFIHWSFDSQLGLVISHSMVGASDDYVNRLVTELPRTFNPKKYDPDEWARLARVCGIKYAVFTTKHHSGFCMFHTQTSDFGVPASTWTRFEPRVSMSDSTSRRTIFTFSGSRGH
jgi:alpha-L-fucosidase